MSSAKKPTKKSVSTPKKQTKEKKLAQEKLSNDDANLLQESLEIVKHLNSEIEKVQKQKQKLQSDVSKLGKKVQTSPSQSSSIKQVSTIKEELIKEFEPIFKNLDVNIIKKELSKEIESLFDIEIQKVKSEVSSISNKSRKELAKRISELELKLMDAIKSNTLIQKELSKNQEQKTFLLKEIENKAHEILSKTTQKSLTLFNTTEKELNELKDLISSYQQENTNLKRQVSILQNSIKAQNQTKEIDLSAIESKLLKLDKENKSIKQLVEKYEDELFNRKKDESSQIEAKVKETLKDAETTLKAFEKQKRGEVEFFIDKVNEIIENVNSFENDMKKFEEKHTKEFEKRLNEKFNLLKKEVLSTNRQEAKDLFTINEKALKNTVQELKSSEANFEKQISNLKTEISLKLQVSLEDFNKEFTKLAKNKESLFAEFDSHLSEKLVAFDKKVREIEDYLKITTEDLLSQKESERNYIAEKLNEIINNFNKLSSENQSTLTKNKEDLYNEIIEVANSELKEAKEQISKQILSNSEFLTKISTEIKEEKRLLHEDIETKLLTSSEQYDKQFQKHVLSFDEELKRKESEFLTKLVAIEDEKNHMLTELNEFKSEISNLTKEYITKLDSELQKIKLEESSFAEQKEAFVAQIDNLTQARKFEIEDFTKEQESKITSVLEEERAAFDRHEETFREVFNDKIQNLSDFTKKRLEQIEKKFVEKNLKYVQSQLDSEISKISSLEESIDTKAQETLRRIDVVEQKEEQMMANLDAEQKQLSEKVEERLVSLEKQLNKRFLELDSQFTNFKGIVIDEVEDLIKEVNSIVNAKAEESDKAITKINFAGSEIVRRIKEFDDLHKTIEDELRDVRDDVNDIRVKMEIVGPQFDSMPGFVQMMSEYESNLLNLVKSLKDRGIDHSSIKQALLNKGHPSFYVKMMLENFDEIKN